MYFSNLLKDCVERGQLIFIVATSQLCLRQYDHTHLQAKVLLEFKGLENDWFQTIYFTTRQSYRFEVCKNQPNLEGMASSSWAKSKQFLANKSKLTNLQTVFFWAPAWKWSLVIAGISDLARPAHKLGSAFFTSFVGFCNLKAP